MKSKLIFLIFLTASVLGGCGLDNKTEPVGQVLIALSQTQRTLHPDLSGLTYTLHFTGTGASHNDEVISVDQAKAVTLEVGEWTVKASGTINGTEISAGEEAVTVQANKSTSLTITMKPISDGTGTFSYNLSLQESMTGTLTLRQHPDPTPVSATGNPANLGAGTNSGSISLSPGVYLVEVDIEAPEQDFDYADIIHIYKNQNTGFSYAPVIKTGEEGKSPITLLDLTPYFEAPKAGNPASGESFEGAQFGGIVVWLSSNGLPLLNANFEAGKAYTASVFIVPMDGFTLEGLGEHSFTHDDASSVTFAPDKMTVTVVFPPLPGELEKASLNITADFWYKDIPITGNSGANIIRKSGTPTSVTFTAPNTYDPMAWFIGVTPAGTTQSLTINAKDYAVGDYNITFTGHLKGMVGTVFYSQVLKLTVERGTVSYTLNQVGGEEGTETTRGALITFNEPIEDLDPDDVQVTGNAIKGELTGEDTEWTQWFTKVSEGNVDVTVTREGVDDTKQSVTVYKLPHFVWMVPGVFVMGERTKQTSLVWPHEVTLTNAYYICDHEVTCGEWTAIMGSTPWSTWGLSVTDDTAASGMNWYQIIAYCNKRSLAEGLAPVYSVEGISDWAALAYEDIPATPGGQGGTVATQDAVWNAVAWDRTANGYRLPTEAEWEFAARGGQASQNYLYSGSDTVAEVGWLGGNPKEVEQLLPNELDIYDMSGNVYEYVWDWYEDFNDETPAVDPSGPASAEDIVTPKEFADNPAPRRTIRGGGVTQTEYQLRVWYRWLAQPSYISPDVGFRVARN